LTPRKKFNWLELFKQALPSFDPTMSFTGHGLSAYIGKQLQVISRSN
jgi:hypothetical protein